MASVWAAQNEMEKGSCCCCTGAVGAGAKGGRRISRYVRLDVFLGYSFLHLLFSIYCRHVCVARSPAAARASFPLRFSGERDRSMGIPTT